ncbi:MAG: hypothetical protein JWM60_1697 [Solirubrobacterales bacterium]|nr:hypothetical protein [Solirubrobacterales bacterium]
MPRRESTDADRERRRTADRERLQRAVTQLSDSEGWKRWVRVRSRNGLARYSLHNQLLIARQRPDASYVAGYRAFLALDRCVRTGEKAIRILAPVTPRTVKPTDSPAQPEAEGERRRTIFTSVCVFDVAQTEPLPGSKPVPLEPPASPVTGDTHRKLLPPLELLANELGYSISYRKLDGTADGWCDNAHRLIAVDGELPANAHVRVLVHEIAHALGVSYEQYGRADAEVIVDTATYIVCSSSGLDVSGSSVPYITGWGETSAGETIERFAAVIDTIARRIEAALTSTG